MNKEAVKDFVYGGLFEFFKNPRNFRYYGQLDFSNLTEEGHASLKELTNVIGCLMLRAEKTEIERKAKELTLSALKDKNS